MKAVILAGGFGTRISEESQFKPKPMVEIGDKPILWHIMKLYEKYGINDFIICAGYKQHVIKEFFADYFLHMSDITFDLANNSIEVHDNHAEHWKVTVVDTGLNTMTGGRIKRIGQYVQNETFMLTYGDAVSDVDLDKLLACHREHGRLLTMTTVQPGGRFGVLDVGPDGAIRRFMEKRKEDGGWVNGGFMAVQPEFVERLPDEEGCVLAWTTPDSRPHATTAHRTFHFVQPEQGGIRLEPGDGTKKCTVYAVDTAGHMRVGDVTV